MLDVEKGRVVGRRRGLRKTEIGAWIRVPWRGRARREERIVRGSE
jgi:hypothetical protein